MTELEKQELLECYRLTKSGKNQYELKRLVRRILQGGVVRQEPEAFASEYEQESGSVNGREHVFAVAVNMLRHAKNVSVRMDSECHCMLNLLYNYVKEHPAAKVQHLVEMNGCSEYNHMESMNYVAELVPLLFASKSYDVYYHYYWQEREMTEKMQWNMLVVEDGLLLFESDLSQGIYCEQMEGIEYYRGLLNKMFQSCRRLACSYSNRSYDDIRLLCRDCLELPDMKGSCVYYKQEEQEMVLIQRRWKHTAAVCLEEERLVRLFKYYIREEQG